MQIKAKTDEMVSFLKKHDEPKLEQLKKDFPQHPDLFEEGQELGDDDLEKQNKTERLKAMAALCKDAVDTVIVKCDEALPQIKLTLKQSINWQLVGQIVTTISGASILVTLSQDYKSISYGLGALGSLGGLVPLIVSSKEKTLDSGKSRSDLYKMLVSQRYLAEANGRELEFYIKHGFNEDGIESVITSTNKLCSEINQQLANI